VKYTGIWTQVGSGGFAEFNITTSAPISVGATASVTFIGPPFHLSFFVFFNLLIINIAGTSISVYGSLLILVPVHRLHCEAADINTEF
jgi:hypothetical protein